MPRLASERPPKDRKADNTSKAAPSTLPIRRRFSQDKLSFRKHLLKYLFRRAYQRHSLFLKEMATAALLDADFGSESEDDNFNPPPADVSDNDAAGDSDAEGTVKSREDPNEQSRRSMFQDGYDGDEDGVSKKRQDEEQNRRRSRDVKVNGNVEEDAQDIVGVYGENGVGDGDEDEEDDEEDEDEDEEAVSVSWVSAWAFARCIAPRDDGLTDFRDVLVNAHAGIVGTNFLTWRPK